MDIVTSGDFSFLFVFLAGLLSFFSPCIIPLIPLYMGYLAGGTRSVDEDGTIHYERRTVMLHTLFFIIGISAAFFLLGAAFTTLGAALIDHRTLLVRFGAILIIIFGIWMLLPGGDAGGEKRFRMPAFKSMNPLAALAMGFLFSFAWTPCVGPMLTAALLMAASAETTALGFALIGLYTLGFVIPFLLVGLFTSQILTWMRERTGFIKWTRIIGGVLLIVIGISMLTGWMNAVTSQLSRFTGASTVIEQTVDSQEDEKEGNAPDPASPDAAAPAPPASADAGTEAPEPGSDPNHPLAPDFTLVDQYGNTVRLSDYRGKVVFLNFWATWCPPCKEEMPDIQAIYEERGENTGDVIILGVANPSTPELINNDGPVEEVTAFLSDNGYTFPVVMDTTNETLGAYRVNSFPTTYVINRDGTVEGYIPGMVSKQMMERAIEQSLAKQ